MKPLPKFDKRAAITEAAEAKTWWCGDCGLPTEEGQSQCTTCIQYWADVDDGIFDNYNDWQREREEEHEALEREEIKYLRGEQEYAHYDEIDDWYYVEY